MWPSYSITKIQKKKKSTDIRDIRIQTMAKSKYRLDENYNKGIQMKNKTKAQNTFPALVKT